MLIVLVGVEELAEHVAEPAGITTPHWLRPATGGRDDTPPGRAVQFKLDCDADMACNSQSVGRRGSLFVSTKAKVPSSARVI